MAAAAGSVTTSAAAIFIKLSPKRGRKHVTFFIHVGSHPAADRQANLPSPDWLKESLADPRRAHAELFRDRVAKLAGGKEKLLAAAKDALATDDNQWAAQLADHLLAINKNDSAAKQIKADALTKLAGNTVNATARNYYLTVARELREESKPE